MPRRAEGRKEVAVTVRRQGRLVIPSRVRRELHIEEGDRLSLLVEGERLVLVPQRAGVAAVRGMFKHLATDRSVVDELIEERREEARGEDAAE
jgi:AbrB family looped-hinge helix DNA binding protein